MSKTRIEALTDGVFAIVLTLLVLDLKVPEGIDAGRHLWRSLAELGPRFAIYFVTFMVLGTLWQMHHMMFHHVFKAVDRRLLPMSLLYLCFVGLVPFSAQLLGTHPEARAASVVYGLNFLAIGLVSGWIFSYGMSHPEVANAVDPDSYRQARIRQRIVPICTLLGLASTALWIPLALIFYAFPVVFNGVPGLLGLAESCWAPFKT